MCKLDLSLTQKSNILVRFYFDSVSADEAYTMNNIERGLFIIINNVDFHQKTEREKRLGSDKDAEDLEDTFTDLGFIVERLKNLTKGEMLAKMEEGELQMS